MQETLLKPRLSAEPTMTTATAPRWGASLVGKTEPLVMAIDNGGSRTRVKLSRGGVIIGRPYVYNTPHNYNIALVRLGQARSRLLRGQDQDHPDATGVSIAAKVSENGKTLIQAGDLTKYGFVDQPFAVDVARVTGVKNDSLVVVYNDCVAGGYAERTEDERNLAKAVFAGVPVDELGDMAYFTWSTGLGGSLVTQEGLVPDEPGHRIYRPDGSCGCGGTTCLEGHIGGGALQRMYGIPGEKLRNSKPALWEELREDVLSGMELTFRTYQAKGLRVVKAAFTGSSARGETQIMNDLDTHLRETFGPNAPQIVEAHFGDDSPLIGAERAADQLARPDGVLPRVIFGGIQEINELRSR